MTSGAAIGIGVAAVGVGAVGYFVLRKKSDPTITGGGALLPPTPGAPSLGKSALRNPASAAVDALQALNKKACTTLVGGKGVPKGVADLGCDIYGKFLSPIGAVETALHVVEKIPVIGGPIKSTERAVVGVANEVARLPLSMVRSPAALGSAAVKLANAPIAVAAKSTQIAAGVWSAAGNAFGSAPKPVQAVATAVAAPLVLAGKTLSLPVHMAAAVVSNPVKAVAGVVKQPVKAVTTIVAAPAKAISSAAKALKFW